MTMATFRIPQELLDRAYEFCERTDTTFSQLARRALRHELGQTEKPNPMKPHEA